MTRREGHQGGREGPDSVDHAKAEHARIMSETRAPAAVPTLVPVCADAAGAALTFVGDVEARMNHIDRHPSDILLAQDFHDLTGGGVAKVVALAVDLEDSQAGSGGATRAA